MLPEAASMGLLSGSLWPPCASGESLGQAQARCGARFTEVRYTLPCCSLASCTVP